jgi:hypothetical protein
MIQKFMKGYLVHKRVWKEINHNKLEECFGFFTELRARLETNSQLKISYIWRKTKRVRRILEAKHNLVMVKKLLNFRKSKYNHQGKTNNIKLENLHQNISHRQPEVVKPQVSEICNI